MRDFSWHVYINEFGHKDGFGVFNRVDETGLI
jgi:hypothetical protein